MGDPMSEDSFTKYWADETVSAVQFKSNEFQTWANVRTKNGRWIELHGPGKNYDQILPRVHRGMMAGMTINGFYDKTYQGVKVKDIRQKMAGGGTHVDSTRRACL